MGIDSIEKKNDRKNRRKWKENPGVISQQVLGNHGAMFIGVHPDMKHKHIHHREQGSNLYDQEVC
jgi:hypothetical protein